VLQRFQALMEKKHAGTLLLSPFEVQAEAKGYHRLDNATDVLGRYQGLVAGARKSWADAHRAEVIAYIRAFSDAVEWLYDPANKDEALTILLKNLPNLGQGGAQPPTASCSAQGRIPAQGEDRHGRRENGARAALEIRAAAQGPERPISYYDPSFYDAAMRR